MGGEYWKPVLPPQCFTNINDTIFVCTSSFGRVSVILRSGQSLVHIGNQTNTSRRSGTVGSFRSRNRLPPPSVNHYEKRVVPDFLSCSIFDLSLPPREHVYGVNDNDGGGGDGGNVF